MIRYKYNHILMEIILMVGIAGSGKSTLTRKLFKNHAHVSLDIIKKWNRTRQKKIFGTYSGSIDGVISKGRKIEYILITKALNDGKNIVVDDTNLTRKIRHRHVMLGQKYNATINVVFFQNIARAYKQNRHRSDGVLEDRILDNQCNELEPPRNDEGFEYIQIIK